MCTFKFFVSHSRLTFASDAQKYSLDQASFCDGHGDHVREAASPRLSLCSLDSEDSLLMALSDSGSEDANLEPDEQGTTTLGQLDVKAKCYKELMTEATDAYERISRVETECVDHYRSFLPWTKRTTQAKEYI